MLSFHAEFEDLPDSAQAALFNFLRIWSRGRDLFLS